MSEEGGVWRDVRGGWGGVGIVSEEGVVGIVSEEGGSPWRSAE